MSSLYICHVYFFQFKLFPTNHCNKRNQNWQNCSPFYLSFLPFGNTTWLLRSDKLSDWQKFKSLLCRNLPCVMEMFHGSNVHYTSLFRNFCFICLSVLQDGHKTLEWSFSKCSPFMEIGYPRWLPPLDKVLTNDHMRNE